MRPANFVTVTGADAAVGRANGLPSDGCRVDELVLCHVPGHDQMSSLADTQIVPADHSAFGQTLDLIQHRRWIDDHPGRDQVLDLGVQDTAGNMVQFVGLVTRYHRMSGIRAPLITNHQIKLRRKQVNELPFCLIAPLKTNYTGTRHHRTPSIQISMPHDLPRRKRKIVSPLPETGNDRRQRLVPR